MTVVFHLSGIALSKAVYFAALAMFGPSSPATFLITIIIR